MELTSKQNTKEKGTEIAVVAEQEHQVFSSLNDFTETTIGFQPFSGVTEAIVEYAEKGYGDVVGTSEEGYEGGEEEKVKGIWWRRGRRRSKRLNEVKRK